MKTEEATELEAAEHLQAWVRHYFNMPKVREAGGVIVYLQLPGDEWGRMSSVELKIGSRQEKDHAELFED